MAGGGEAASPPRRLVSRFGRWIEVDGLPAFDYTIDPHVDEGATWDPIVAPLSTRHWVVIGNRRINAVVDNHGTAALFDEHEGLRWITAPDPSGTGESIIDGQRGVVRSRVFGPTSFAVELDVAGFAITRTITAPEGEPPWVVVHVAIRNPGSTPQHFAHVERWAVRPRCAALGISVEAARENARRAVRYRVDTTGERVAATEERTAE